MNNKSLLYPVVSTSRRVVSLDGMWRFSFDAKSEGVEANWANGLPESISMPVPASFCDFFTDKESREYCGDFWYETDFFVPGEWSGKDIAIRFGSATHHARIFVNGVEVAQHEGGFLPFDAVVTDIVRYNQFNKLSVLLNNELNEHMLPAGNTAVLSNGKKVAAPYFDFYNYAGIHRPVKLMALPTERILDYSVKHRLTAEGAEVDYTVTTNGDHEVTVELYDGATKVAEATGKEGTLVVKDAKLWNVHAAYLYNIVIRIHDGSAVVDEYTEKVGIRTFEIKDGHFLLNGKPVYLRGFGKHEDADIRGRGLDLATVKRDYELMKWIGANCFRTSHYPYAEEFYDLCDREGILVMDETPAVGIGGGAAVNPYKEYPLAEHHRQVLVEMIHRDKNHPCVVLWSLGNEPDLEHFPQDAYDYWHPLYELAHQLDPQDRPVTLVCCQNDYTKDITTRTMDIVCINRYYGWYNLSGDMDAACYGLNQELDFWAEQHKPVMMSEYGADTVAGLHTAGAEMFSEEFQVEFYRRLDAEFDKRPWFVGEFVWNFADYDTVQGPMRVDGNKKGLFTRDRRPKLGMHFLRQRWAEIPTFGFKE